MAGEASLRPLGAATFNIDDDVGTRYEWIGGGSSGNPAHGMTIHAPAVPAAAKRLTVLTVGRLVEFDLSEG